MKIRFMSKILIVGLLICYTTKMKGQLNLGLEFNYGILNSKNSSEIRNFQNVALINEQSLITKQYNLAAIVRYKNSLAFKIKFGKFNNGVTADSIIIYGDQLNTSLIKEPKVQYEYLGVQISLVAKVFTYKKIDIEIEAGTLFRNIQRESIVFFNVNDWNYSVISGIGLVRNFGKYYGKVSYVYQRSISAYSTNEVDRSFEPRSNGLEFSLGINLN